MPFITDPLFYLVAVPAVLLFAMSKGGFGGSASSLSIPMMALVVDPITAAAVMLPVLLVMDGVAVWKFRHQWSATHLTIMIPAAIGGIAFAGTMMDRLSTDALRILIGVISLGFCLQYWGLPSLSRRKPGRPAGYFWGMVAGFTSTQIHAGGVPASIYLLPQRMDKLQLMGTFALFFAAVNLIKLVPYALLGQLDTTNLSTSLVLMPLAPVGVLLGYRLLNLVEEQMIYRILYAFLFLAALKLIWDGLV